MLQLATETLGFDNFEICGICYKQPFLVMRGGMLGQVTTVVGICL